MDDKDNTHFAIRDVLQTEEESGWSGSPFVDLKCPVCQTNYQHVGRPTTISGEDYAVPWGGRGDLVVVPLQGECGHKWEICLGFHKGNTAIFARAPKTSSA